MRILVVEDHPDTLRCLQAYLKNLGHAVTTAATMKAALAAAPTADCDVLISDLGLPDGSGWELLEQAQFPRPVYAVAMSGFAMASDLARSQAAGFRRHIVKPFGGDDLREALEEAASELKASTPGRAKPSPARAKKSVARKAPHLTPAQIADRLHDAPFQTLSAARLLLAAVMLQLPPDAADVRQQLKKVDELLDECCAELGALGRELRSAGEKDSPE